MAKKKPRVKKPKTRNSKTKKPQPQKSKLHYIADIDRIFEHAMRQREQDLAANREAETFDEILIGTCINALMTAYFNDRENSWEIEIETPEDQALELSDDRILDAFELDSSPGTSEQMLERIRFLFSEIEGYSDAENELLEAHPEVAETLETAYADYRTIEKFFRKYEDQLSI